MEKYKFESKSKENLLNLALDELDVTESDILYNITEEKKGLFGGKKYYIEIIKINLFLFIIFNIYNYIYKYISTIK